MMFLVTGQGDWISLSAVQMARAQDGSRQVWASTFMLRVPEQNLAVTHLSRDGHTLKADSDGTVAISRSVGSMHQKQANPVGLVAESSQTGGPGLIIAQVASGSIGLTQVDRHEQDSNT